MAAGQGCGCAPQNRKSDYQNEDQDQTQAQRADMTTFPGFIFDGEGRPLDNRASSLTQEELDACEYRSAVQAKVGSLAPDGLAPVALIWLLNDDATFAAIPPAILSVTVEMARKGQSVLVLARHPEVGVEIRDGLLEALELAQAPAEMVEPFLNATP